MEGCESFAAYGTLVCFLDFHDSCYAVEDGHLVFLGGVDGGCGASHPCCDGSWPRDGGSCGVGVEGEVPEFRLGVASGYGSEGRDGDGAGESAELVDLVGVEGCWQRCRCGHLHLVRLAGDVLVLGQVSSIVVEGADVRRDGGDGGLV